MTTAQRTPGPWKVARSIYADDARPFTVYRDSGTPHYSRLLDKRGRERRFSTATAATRAADRADRIKSCTT